MEPTLLEILDAREQRVQKQQALLARCKTPLLCFTMNIPGPEKYNSDISAAFYVGDRLLQDRLRGQRVLHRELIRSTTGCEAFYAVDMPALQLKQIAVELEQTDPIGRLFDMDVLECDGRKISRQALGLPPRKCLLCENDAVVCARSRAHGLEALHRRTAQLLHTAGSQWLAEYIAATAYLALHTEFTTTPKPGLVDRENRGAHPDMGIRHFFASTNALRPFLCRFAEEGYLTRELPPQETFRRIRGIGKDAEKAMLQATGGVNTHKGAIFSMGVLCAAAGRTDPALWSPEQLCAEAAAMCDGVVKQELAGVTNQTAATPGEQFYVQYGVTGARGQAEAGFPAVLNTGLPILKQALAQGCSLNDAGSITLLHLIAAHDDTNLIRRGGRQLQLQLRQQFRTMLAQTPFPTVEAIAQLDREFIEKNLSPGGSADLLALTYYLYFLCKG